MPRVSDEYLAARRAEIVTAAGRLFAEEGFHATSMADIIGEAGLSAGAVYRYFRSKEEIIAAVAETALSTADGIFDRLLTAPAVPTPAQVVEAVIDGVVGRAANDPVTGQDLTRIALQVWAEALRNPEVNRRVNDTFQTLRGHFAEVVRRWHDAGMLPGGASADNVALALLGLTQGFLLQNLLVTGISAADYLNGVQALLRTGATSVAAQEASRLSAPAAGEQGSAL